MLDKLQYFLSYLFIRILTFDYCVIRRVIGGVLARYKYETILDFGCGIGILAPLFPRKKYLGFDKDEKAIAFAKVRNPGYSFIVSDATNLKLNKKFDLIVVIGVLHHLDDQEAKAALKTIRFLLAKNGVVLIIEPIPPIYKWNILGYLLRASDKGHFVRKMQDYKKLMRDGLGIKEQYAKIGGLLDYGVFIISG